MTYVVERFIVLLEKIFIRVKRILFCEIEKDIQKWIVNQLKDQ